MKETTFSHDCLKAIAHLSKPMQDRIIADVTRYRLTGEMPEKMPAMRLALFKALILMLDPETDPKDLKAPKDLNDLNDPNDLNPSKDTPATPSSSEPNYVAIDPRGNITPLYIPAATTPAAGKITRAERRRLQRAIS